MDGEGNVFSRRHTTHQDVKAHVFFWSASLSVGNARTPSSGGTFLHHCWIHKKKSLILSSARNVNISHKAGGSAWSTQNALMLSSAVLTKYVCSRFHALRPLCPPPDSHFSDLTKDSCLSSSSRFPHSLMLGPSGMHPTGIPHPAIVPPTGKQDHDQYDRSMYV